MNSTVKTSTTPSMVENVMKVRILVVDDDKICLAVTASVLKLFNYEVVTINCPLEALSSLRMNPDSFDIVLSDVHMPLMNGLNFQRIVELEFHIPVILMSSDDKKNLLMRSLENGAAFFIVKPPSISDLKNIWQYVIARRKNNATIANATIANAIVVKDDVETCNNNDNNNNAMAMFNNNNNNQSDDVFAQAASYGNNNNNNNVLETSSSDNQRQLSMIDKEDNNIEGKSTSSSGSKKPKLIWTTALHNKFLEAISVIGTSRAVPKKILEYMNVPGLTRENIASHLQKYRIYVRKLNEANGGLQHGFPINWNERPFRSSFSWSQFPTLANNSYLLKYSNTINHQPQTRAPIPNNYGPHHQGLPLFNNTPQNTPFVPSSMINNHLGPDFVDDHKLNFNIDITTRSTNIIDSSTVDSANNTNASIFDMARHNGLANGDDGPMLGLFRHNNADNQFNNNNSNSNNNNNNNKNNSNNSSNNNNAFLERLSNTAPTNNQVDNNMSNMNNSASIGVGQQGTASNPSNAIVPSSNVDNKVPIGRVGSANNNANATLQSQAVEDTKDILTLSSTSARTSVPHNDWAPNHMDDFNLEYGMEDINAIFSNIDAQNGNNN